MELDLRDIGGVDEQLVAAIRLPKQGVVGWLVPTRARVKRLTHDLRQRNNYDVIVANRVDDLPHDLSSLIDQGLTRKYYQLPGGAVVARFVPQYRYQQVFNRDSIKPLVVYAAKPLAELPEAKEVKGRSDLPQPMQLVCQGMQSTSSLMMIALV